MKSNHLPERELWERITQYFQEKFGVENGTDVEAMLFLIGVRELGSGRQNYSKDEKLNLLHIAVCRLLIPFGYYEFSHNDNDGFPHFLQLQELPILAPNEQRILMQKAIIQYFKDEDILESFGLD